MAPQFASLMGQPYQNGAKYDWANMTVPEHTPQVILTGKRISAVASKLQLWARSHDAPSNGVVINRKNSWGAGAAHALCRLAASKRYA